jgi:hypothetical protein
MTPGPISASAVEEAFEQLLVSASAAAAGEPGARLPAREGTSTAEDKAALRATFEELAVGHVVPIRNFMLEVRWGEAQSSWIALARPRCARCARWPSR